MDDLIVSKYSNHYDEKQNTIYIRDNIFRMENATQAGLYCIYCGSPNIRRISMEKKEGENPRSLTAHFVGTGGGYSGKRTTSNTVTLDTDFCMKCKMTEAKGAVEPGRAWITDSNGYNLEIILPESLLRYFSSIRLEDRDIEMSVKSIAKKLKQIINKFERTGINPCKKGKIGWKTKMDVGIIKIDVYVLVENDVTGRYARIIYGGGRSYCK